MDGYAGDFLLHVGHQFTIAKSPAGDDMDCAAGFRQRERQTRYHPACR
jgi:hypothetical protein